MPSKRPISLGDEEELLTKPHHAVSSAPYRQQHDSQYDLELAGSETEEIERQRLLPTATKTAGGHSGGTSSKAYRNANDEYLPEEASEITLGTSRKALKATKRRQRRIAVLGAILGVILLGGFFGRSFLYSKPPTSGRGKSDDMGTLMSNGTHDYRKTVLVVSIDGLRYVVVSEEISGLTYCN